MPKVSAAPATPAVRRCELCGKPLSLYNSGKYCKHHRQAEIEQFLASNRSEEGLPSAEEVLAAVGRVWRVHRGVFSESSVTGKYNQNVFEARRAAMYLLRKDARIQINAISALLGLMHEAQINDHIKKVHADMQVDEGLNRRISAARALYAPKAPA